MPSEIAQGDLDQFTSRTRSSGIHGIAVSPVNEQLGFLWVKHEALIDVSALQRAELRLLPLEDVASAGNAQGY